MAVLPDGRVLVTERPGRVRIIGSAAWRVLRAARRARARAVLLRPRPLPLGGTSVAAAAPPGTYDVRVYALGGPTGSSHSSNELVVVVP